MLTDDLIATFSSAQAAFTERVHAVAPDQWQLGSRTRSGPSPTWPGIWSTPAPTRRSLTGWWR
jgi:hypothetical protein